MECGVDWAIFSFLPASLPWQLTPSLIVVSPWSWGAEPGDWRGSAGDLTRNTSIVSICRRSSQHFHQSVSQCTQTPRTAPSLQRKSMGKSADSFVSGPLAATSVVRTGQFLCVENKESKHFVCDWLLLASCPSSGKPVCGLTGWVRLCLCLTPSHSELQTTSVLPDHRGATTTHHQAFAAASFQTLHEKADVLRSSAFLADFSHSLDDTPQWWTYSGAVK